MIQNRNNLLDNFKYFLSIWIDLWVKRSNDDLLADIAKTKWEKYICIMNVAFDAGI